MAVRLQYFPSPQPAVALLARGLAIVLAFVCAGLVLGVAGANPIALAAKVVQSTFGSSFGLQDVSLLVTPLILTGLAVAVALKVGAWNIGAEGQFYAGAFAATGIGLFIPGPTVVILPLMFVGGALCGVLWILIPTLARAYAGVSELITTLLLNFEGTLLAYYVTTGPWLDPGGHALGTTARVPHSVPEIWGDVHWGFPLAIMPDAGGRRRPQFHPLGI